MTNPAVAGYQARSSWGMIPFSEQLWMTLQDLESRPRRTLLTILSMVIGSAGLVAVTSVGLAGRDYAVRQLEALGTNFIWVSYGGPADVSPTRIGKTTGGEITEDDFQQIESDATALAAVTRVIMLYSSASRGGKTYPVAVVGADGAFAQVRNLTIDGGRALTAADISERRKVCVLARSLADKLYSGVSPVGDSLRLEGLNFDIVGVFRDVRTPVVQTEISRDAVLIPISVARLLTTGNSVDTIYGQARSRESLDLAVAQIRRVLERNHGRADLYTVNTLRYFVRAVSSISAGLLAAVTVLALIALLVGGVGIYNILTMTVSERTREIGIHMAIGARRREIRRFFLCEAVVVSLVGGLLGILLGSLGPLLIHAFSGFPMPISLASIGAALLVSVLVGTVFGVLPASKAAALDPVEALRYE